MRVFTFNDWIAVNGHFAIRTNEIKLQYENFGKLIDEMKSIKSIEVEWQGEYQNGNYPCYLFSYEEKEILINQLYIDLITNQYPEDYRYEYSPEHNMILVYDEDDWLIGFVKEMLKVE